MKRRYADARNSSDILESEFKNFYINDANFKGNISILRIKKVKQKWCVDEENRCILNDNYTWMEIYPTNKNYCITVMLDENKNIKEWYFDICKQNGVEDGVPFEDDLYLDVVIVPDGRIHVLDEDELQEAFESEIITKEDIELAYNTKDLILKEYGQNIEKLKIFTEIYKTKIINES